MNNTPKKTHDLSCSIFIAIIIVLVIIYKAVEFFRQPDAIYQFINFIEALGLCFGVVILLIFSMVAFEKISNKIKGRFITKSSDFSVRFISTKMEKFDNWQYMPDDLSEDLTQETSFPTLATMTMTNYGVWFKDINSETFSDNKNSFWKEFNNKFLDNSIIPINSINLYYVIFRVEGNLAFELKPSRSFGFKNQITNIPKDNQLKLIIIFKHVRKKIELQKIITLEQPVKLKLAVLDENGNDDLFATINLYKLIYESIKEIESEEDDSWMYRSRPFYW